MKIGSIKLPSTFDIESVSGLEITAREPLRETVYSVLEVLQFKGQQHGSAVLKTTLPELKHEIAVHRFAGSMDISATHVIAADDSAEYPWQLMSRVRPLPGQDEEPGYQDVCSALDMLARFHAATVDGAEARPDAPDRTVEEILKPDARLVELVEEVYRIAGRKLDVTITEQFVSQLQYIKRKLKPLSRSLVHGDFDPGNLILARGRWRALDWGLSHRNVPLVDLAHMSFRFPPDTRETMYDRYFNVAQSTGLEFDATGSKQSLVSAAMQAHLVFFIWWHSHCIVDLGAPADSLADVVIARCQWIADLTGNHC